MMTVRTRLGISPIHGIGLFALEPIAAGTITWRLSPWDQRFSAADLAALDPAARAGIAHHLYRHDGVWVLCFDHGRFMNHSDDPNTDAAAPEVNRARRDIAIGEELTCDYRVFDEAFDPGEVSSL
jgi:uncharacterized protein